MDRLLGPDAGSRYAYNPDGSPAANASAVIYSNSAGTIPADLRAYDGSETPGGTVLGSVVSYDGHGQSQMYWFPPGRQDRVWGSVNGGPLFPIDADNNRRVDRLESQRLFSVRAYGAAGDDATDDSAAILAAAAEALAVGGTVYFPPGTYRTAQPIPIYSNVDYVGAGIGATTVKLANAANTDVFKTDQFDTLYAGTSQGGPSRWSLRHMTIDGNAATQSAGWPLSIYGCNYELESLQITGGRSGGIRSKWGTGGTNMEARTRDVKVFNNAGLQLDWQGPHDSQFHNLTIFTDNAFHAGTAIAGSRAIRISGPTAGGDQFTNVHIWGYHEVGFHVANTSNGDVKVYNGTSEGAQINVWLDADLCIWDGTVYCTNGIGPYAGTEVGIRVGTEPGATRWMNRVRGTVWNHAAGDKPIYLAGDDGNDVDCAVRIDAATAAVFYRSGVTAPSPRSRVNIICPDNRVHAVSTQGFGGRGVPPADLGIVGSYYQRWDGTTGSRLYHKTAVGTWTAIL